MYGDKAAELIRQLVRNNVEVIPAYQSELVEEIKKENNELYAENLKTSQVAATSNSQPTEADKSEPCSSNDPQPEEEHDIQEELEQVVDDNVDIGEKEIMVMQVRHTAMLWNKRCVIAYHFERLKRLKQLRWDYGNNLPIEIVRNLSKAELKWFTDYNDNLFSYMKSLNDGQGLDLTAYVTPPKRLYVQVKCIRDYGQFDLEDGQPVMLKKDSIHYLPLSQCEKLIHQGVLEQTNS